MKKLILLISLVFVFACSSNDDSSNCADISEQGIAVIEALFDASVIYFNTPSSASCLAYTEAISNYITYSQSILDCLEGTDLSELQAEIVELQLELTNLNCD